MMSYYITHDNDLSGHDLSDLGIAKLLDYAVLSKEEDMDSDSDGTFYMQ